MQRRRAVHRFTTSGGLLVKIYRIKPQDSTNLVNLFEHLSTNSRYQRFNESLVDPDPDYVLRTADSMARVDPRAGAAWLAFSDLPGEPNAPVAGARYMRLPDGKTAEVSIAVRDDLHQQGIGAELLLYLARHARNNGVRQLLGRFDTGNKGVWRLVQRAPFAVTTTVQGSETEVVIHLDQPSDRAVDRAQPSTGELDGRPNLAKEPVMSSEIVATWRLANGLELRVRPQTADDVQRLAQLFEHVNPERRLERVGSALPGSTSEALREATKLAQLGPGEGCVWLAFADLPGQPDSLVASGRFLRCSLEEAEMSIVVRDDMQGQGIGSKLLYFVLEQARAMGVQRMYSYFANDNEAVWQIFNYSPYHITWQPRGKQVEVVTYLQARTEGSPSLN